MTNTVHIMGNLGKDPHVFDNGNMALTVADNRSEKRGDEWQEVTEWHDVFINSKRFHNYAQKYATKGATVTLRGELRYKLVDLPEGSRPKQVKQAIIVINDDGQFQVVRGAGQSSETTD